MKDKRLNLLLQDEVITCTRNGYTYVNIDDYDGTVQISSPGFFSEGMCYADGLDQCGWIIYTNEAGASIEMQDSYHEVKCFIFEWSK